MARRDKTMDQELREMLEYESAVDDLLALVGTNARVAGNAGKSGNRGKGSLPGNAGKR